MRIVNDGPANEIETHTHTHTHTHIEIVYLDHDVLVVQQRVLQMVGRHPL